MIGKVISGLRVVLILLLWVAVYQLYGTQVKHLLVNEPYDLTAKFVRPDAPEPREYTPDARCADVRPFDPLLLDAGRSYRPSADDTLRALQDRAAFDRAEFSRRPTGFTPDEVARETSRRALAFQTDIGRDMTDQHPSTQVRAGDANDPIYRLERDCPEVAQ